MVSCWVHGWRAGSQSASPWSRSAAIRGLLPQHGAGSRHRGEPDATQLLDISLWRDKEHTRPFGIFDDGLPSRQALATMGLPVKDDYDPEALRSYDEQTDDDAGDT